jgi:hypothetical protein
MKGWPGTVAYGLVTLQDGIPGMIRGELRGSSATIHRLYMDPLLAGRCHQRLDVVAHDLESRYAVPCTVAPSFVD